MSNVNIDRIIYKNIADEKPVDNLIKIGLSYHFLAKKYEEMLDNKEIIINGRNFVLTKFGKEKLSFLEKKINKDFIEPLNNHKIDKISKDDVYLPKN